MDKKRHATDDLKVAKVKLVERRKGWFFEAGKRKVGPYADPEQQDVLVIAAQLSDKTDEVKELRQILKRAGDAEKKTEASAFELREEYTAEVRTWPIQPKDVFSAKVNFPGTAFNIRIDLGKLEAHLVGKRVKLETIVAGKSQRKALPEIIRALHACKPSSVLVKSCNTNCNTTLTKLRLSHPCHT